MSHLEWSACCSFFSIPLTIYLRFAPSRGSDLWSVIKKYKKWDHEDLEKQKQSFYSEFKWVRSQDVILWEDPQYPEPLRRLHSPPLCLYTLGDRSILHQKLLAVIGSRQPSPLFLNWMNHELGVFLTQNQVAIVSGGAFGVDQRATQVALRHGKSSVVVLPSGLENFYPKEIEFWRKDPNILFLSEYMPRQEMRRHHFVKRNRLIAGLTDHLFVVQCAIKSGSMITVKYAIDLNISVGTVPDFPNHYESSGNLSLLQEGAILIKNALDLKEFMGWGESSLSKSNSLEDAFATKIE